MFLLLILALFPYVWASPSVLFHWMSALSPNRNNFEVKRLPDAPELPKSWAGRIQIPKAPDGNALFFWLFDSEEKASDDNLIVWLNGGPGCTSLFGTFLENGPLSFAVNSSKLERNPYSWTKLGHVLYIDQPAGTGYATAKKPVTTNEEVTSNLFSWLQEFDRLFPGLLRSKKVHFVGESYAGVYIPYIAVEIMRRKDELPINLQSIAIGDGSIGNNAAMSSVPTVAFLKKYSKELNIPRDILTAFSFADHACGFDMVLSRAATYPPRAPIIHIPGNPGCMNFKRGSGDTPVERRNFEADQGKCNIRPDTPEKIKSSILNSSCYGPCATFDTAADYLGTRSDRCFNLYNIRYNCATPNPIPAMEAYLSRADVQTALNLNQRGNQTNPFKSCNQSIMKTLFSPANRPTPPAYHLLPELLETHKLPVHIYQGQLDMLINNIGVELVLQNMTWNGAQGFQEKPHRQFGSGSSGAPVGLWTEERGLSYHLFYESGHAVPRDTPADMFEYLKDVVVKSKKD
ncbi:hypothetical protein FQN57_005827 [Myotisia sp. PD_48]|nr:hypothetical protein FQN57_005827 [Myotisia sp. PD_48]